MFESYVLFMRHCESVKCEYDLYILWVCEYDFYVFLLHIHYLPVLLPVPFQPFITFYVIYFTIIIIYEILWIPYA